MQYLPVQPMQYSPVQQMQYLPVQQMQYSPGPPYAQPLQMYEQEEIIVVPRTGPPGPPPVVIPQAPLNMIDKAECDLRIRDVEQRYGSILADKDQILSGLSQENQKVTGQLNTNISAVSTLTRATKEAEARAAAAERRAEAADAAQTRAAAAEAKAAALEAKAKEAERRAEERAKAADAAEAKARVAEEDKLEAERRVAAAIQAENTASLEKASAERRAAAAERTIATTLASKAMKSKAEDEAIRQLQDANQQKLAAETQLAEARQEAIRLQKIADTAEAEAVRLREESGDVSQASRVLQTQIHELTQNYDAANAEIQKLKIEIQQLTASLSAASSTLPIATQQQELDDLKQELAVKEKELDNLKQQLENVQKPLPCPSPVISFGLPQNPSSCTPKDLEKIYPNFKEIFIKDPDTLFNLLLTFINTDIEFYLQTYPINDELILVFIPLFTLFIDEKYSSLNDAANFDKDYNYQTINYITFKKIFNIYYDNQHNKKQQLLAIFQKLTLNPDILTKLHKIINIILNVGLYKITGDTDKLTTGGKKYLGGFNSNYTAYKNVYLQTCVNIYLYETKHIAMTNPQTNYNEDKLKSIITFIMRFYMNTLPYYIHNLFYHISKSSPPSSEYDTFKAKIKEIDTANSNITEDEIYIKLLSALEDPTNPTNPANIPYLELQIQKLCQEYYYNFMTCNDNSSAYLSHTNRNFFLKGGDEEEDGSIAAAATSLPPLTAANIANIAEISFTNPYYLLNHVSMDLCLLKICYEEIQKELKQHSNDIFDNEIKGLIKTAYDDIKNLIKDDVI